MPRSDPPRRPRGEPKWKRDKATGTQWSVKHEYPTGNMKRDPGKMKAITDGMREAPTGPGRPELPTLRPSGKSHLRLGNRKGMLIAAGAATTGGGGLAYTHKKRQDGKAREASVVKLHNPFEVAKADDDKPSGSSAGRKFWAAAVPTVHGAVAGREGKKLRATGNEFVGSNVGAAPGAIGTLLAARRGSARGVTAGSIATQAGYRGGGLAGNARNERKGYLKPVGKAMDAGSVTQGTRLHAISVRSVSPVMPKGGSNVNDLSVTRHKRKTPINGQLQRYSSGSQEQMTGGGRAFGNSARHVRKSFDDLGASTVGTRGTPMTDISRSGRVGRRLTSA